MKRVPLYSGNAGIALVHVVLLLTIVTAIAGGAAMLARVEILVSRYQRDEREAAYAAQAMLAAALQDLGAVAEWDDVLTGTRAASFADGAVSAPRRIPGGGTVLVCCGAGTLAARLQTESGLPWRPFGWHSLNGLLDVPSAGPYYLVAWVVDDPDDRDGDPDRDSNNRIVVRAEAHAPRGSRKAAQVTMERAPPDAVSGLYPPGLQMLTWREIR